MTQSFPSRRCLAARSTRESPVVRWVLVGLALGFLTLFLHTLGAVFHEALKKGWSSTGAPSPIRTKHDTPDAAHGGDRRAAQPRVRRCRGVGDAKFEFPGRERPDHVDRSAVFRFPGDRGSRFRAPVGAQGWFGPWLQAHDIKIIFAVPGIVLATIS